MTNHYEILGLKPEASGAQIKMAFRGLAKLYHPDKNPHGKEHFSKILKAYEVLSNPSQKSTYDFRLKYNGNLNEQAPNKPGTKVWKFDEKELKRRQYYNDFIKKQTEEASAFDAAKVDKKRYSDYKYIFFATPLAVILFLLIMMLATPKRLMRKQQKAEQTHTKAKINNIKIETGDAMYDNFFGPQKYDTIKNIALHFENNAYRDVIVCVFSFKHFLRAAFVKRRDVLVISDLPEELVQIRLSEGNIAKNKFKDDRNRDSAIATNLHFYKSLQTLHLRMQNTITLQGSHTGFKEITAKEFFTVE